MKNMYLVETVVKENLIDLVYLIRNKDLVETLTRFCLNLYGSVFFKAAEALLVGVRLITYETCEEKKLGGKQ